MAQVAAVALLIDYIVTVAVQTAAGSAAIVSAFPALARPLGPRSTLLIVSVVAILIMCYGNLRGIREAGRTFAVPTYLFSGAVGLLIVVGVVREVVGGGLPLAHPAPPGPNGTVLIGHGTASLLAFGSIFVLARAFANGGSSLTGIEAVSNAVSALRPPEGRNARRILVIQGSIVAFLIAGISWLAHVTHATPYTQGYPTVLAQEASLIFGHGALGRVLFYAVQAGTATILFTGGNTSFSGFPFLASFVAEDSFLPRWLTKRGHRLVFSSGIIVLTVVSLTLLIVVGANVNRLIPFYAIGVFTGFTMAGFGMARYHRRHRGPHWRRHFAISVTGGIYTGLVVMIFAIVKFTEGAWLVVVVFPLLVFAFIRLNRQYRMEATVLEGIGSRGGPAPAADLLPADRLRLRRRLRPGHDRGAPVCPQPPADLAARGALRDRQRAGRQAAPGLAASKPWNPARIRRLPGPAARQLRGEPWSVPRLRLPGVGVTAILPRRSYAPIVGRLLHDRTADKMAAVISRIPHAAATIVPFDVRSRVESLAGRGPMARAAAAAAMPHADSRPSLPPSRTANRPASRCQTTLGTGPTGPTTGRPRRGA